MRRTIHFLTLVALVAGAGPLSAQSEGGRVRERWQATLDGEHYVWDIRLVRLDGDSLVIRQADTLARLPVEHITEIRLIRPSRMGLDEAAGGGALNALTGSDDEIHDLTTLEPPERVRAIRQILLDHPAEP